LRGRYVYDVGSLIEDDEIPTWVIIIIVIFVIFFFISAGGRSSGRRGSGRYGGGVQVAVLAEETLEVAGKQL